jgi:hypothetical protein
MARVYTKKGDLFFVKIDDNTKKYFQLIAYDLTQLNSDVIRAFKKQYAIDENPSVSVIIQDDVEFYTHCVTKWGVKMGYWEKVGNIPEVGALDHILFRGTTDYGKRIKISQNWYVWNINDKFRDVGILVGENRKAEIGIIVTPEDIVERIKTGKYSFSYPGFE